MEEKELQTLEIKTERNDDDDFKGIPPCLEALLSEGVKEGQRNECMYNVGVYLKKRFPEREEWRDKMDKYNEKYFSPQIGSTELEKTKESVAKKEYNYKCKSYK